jgi:hypothetical protein
VLNCTIKDCQFQEKFILLDICGTKKASSADCEHGFGIVNLITSLNPETDHLETVMQTKSHTSPTKVRYINDG